MQRFSSTAGIAIGPILFVIALLGILAAVTSTNIGSFGTATSMDRVTADVGSQANLIRSKINECHMQYLANGVNNSVAPCAGDPYPCSDQTNGTPVTDLTCPGDPLDGGGNQPHLWMGLRTANLAPPSPGFQPWYYMNAGASGGRCFWTSPTGGKTAAIVAGLSKVAARFTSQEHSYLPASESQKFVVFITRPTGEINPRCAVP